MHHASVPRRGWGPGASNRRLPRSQETQHLRRRQGALRATSGAGKNSSEEFPVPGTAPQTYPIQGSPRQASGPMAFWSPATEQSGEHSGTESGLGWVIHRPFVGLLSPPALPKIPLDDSGLPWKQLDAAAETPEPTQKQGEGFRTDRATFDWWLSCISSPLASD